MSIDRGQRRDINAFEVEPEGTLSQRLRRAAAVYSSGQGIGVGIGVEADVGSYGYDHEYDSNSNYGPPSARKRTKTKIRSALLSQDLIKKYIAYARRYCHPRLTPAAAKVLQKLYLTMRAQSSVGASIPVTTRHLESLIRLAQARAKMDLREEVS